MLCASASPVKYEGKPEQNERQPKSRQPDLQELRSPVAFGGDANAVAANEIDLSR
jgi:hypothetical protein